MAGLPQRLCSASVHDEITSKLFTCCYAVDHHRVPYARMHGSVFVPKCVYICSKDKFDSPCC